jgi:hypothetical protein
VGWLFRSFTARSKILRKAMMVLSLWPRCSLLRSQIAPIGVPAPDVGQEFILLPRKHLVGPFVVYTAILQFIRSEVTVDSIRLYRRTTP